MSKKLVKTLKTVLKFTPVAIAVALFIRFATDPLFYLDWVSNGFFIVIALIPIPTIFCYSHPFLKSILLLFGLPLIVKILDIKPKEINELNNGDYYLSTGILTYKFKSGFYSFASSSRLVFSSLQAGYESMSLNPYDDKHRGKKIADTVILRMAYDLPNYMVVQNINPTREEIQKYMEPVLFVNKVEQPLPIYDTLKLSLDKENKLLRHSHRQVVSVVRKRQDDFLRNLVTIQINDTLQRTVNLMYKDEPNYKEVFESLNVGDKLIARVSDVNPTAVRIVNWRPTNEEFERNGKISPNAIIATIHSKEIKHVYQEYEHIPIYRVQLLVDGVRSNYVEIPGKGKDERKQLYKSLNEGDTVMIKVDETTDSVAVINWHPTAEEIKKNQPIKRPDSKKADLDIATIYTKKTTMVSPTQKSKYYWVKLKCRETISEYMKIDDMYRRQIYESLEEGDTVIIQKPKSNSEKIQVLSWHPTPEEKEKYRTQVQMIEY